MKGKHHTEESRQKISQSNKGRICSGETRKKISDAQKGSKSFWYGKKQSLVIVEKRKQKMFGHKAWNKGVACTIESKQKQVYTKRLRNSCWKGGTTSLYDRIRKSFEYRQWRSDVFTRDKFTCQLCGDNQGGNLNAHHIKFFAEILKEHKVNTFESALKCEELWNINNGITLCILCHDKNRK
jgi:5-methylcytosine-specific restriction endonuclease McrA